ncbi:MAG TPA: phosphoribosylglycinamide formyltransferase [Caulobacteraceae bacterium]|nr:phosphoribosylglycinamide formyltransferase [Caulobacteraceae bacterium]
MIRLAFLASNNGSGMRAVVTAIEAGKLDAKPVLVVSNRAQAPALAFAQAHGIPTKVLTTREDPAGADARLAVALGEARPDWVVLSGYLRRLGAKTLSAFAGRVLNIHPALLPKFGGEGMYGRRVHEAVIAAGETISGASVHLVDEVYDRGRVLARAETPISAADTAASVESRVMALEGNLLVGVLRRLAEGKTP